MIVVMYQSQNIETGEINHVMEKFDKYSDAITFLEQAKFQPVRLSHIINSNFDLISVND